jgi:Flavoprotein
MSYNKVNDTRCDDSDYSRRDHRILLGVTGSVAAIKAPEIAIELINCLGCAQVKVLITKGGETFWDKAKDYAPAIWEKFQKYQQPEHADDPESKHTPKISVYCKYPSMHCCLYIVLPLN